MQDHSSAECLHEDRDGKKCKLAPRAHGVESKRIGADAVSHPFELDTNR